MNSFVVDVSKHRTLKQRNRKWRLNGHICFYFIYFLWINEFIFNLFIALSHAFSKFEVNILKAMSYLSVKVNPLYIDTRLNHKIRYNDNLNVTKPSLNR